jgi:kynurenine formamidase
VIARSSVRVIDLAQPLSPATHVWPGLEGLSAQTTGTVAQDGFFARIVTVGEHTGTHLDAPAHFHEGGVTVEGIPAEDLVCETAVIDVRAACALDADYTVSAADVLENERAHGQLPARGAVLVCTGWSAFTDDGPRYVGDLHCPGVSPEAAQLLVERGIAGLGIDTLSVDAGQAPECPTHHITLPAGFWQLEGLVNLELLPPRGALLVVGVPPLTGGSGMPARPLALLPA